MVTGDLEVDHGRCTVGELVVDVGYDVLVDFSGRVFPWLSLSFRRGGVQMQCQWTDAFLSPHPSCLAFWMPPVPFLFVKIASLSMDSANFHPYPDFFAEFSEFASWDADHFVFWSTLPNNFPTGAHLFFCLDPLPPWTDGFPSNGWVPLVPHSVTVTDLGRSHSI